MTALSMPSFSVGNGNIHYIKPDTGEDANPPVPNPDEAISCTA